MARCAQRILALGVIDHRRRVIAGQAHRELNEIGALPIAIGTDLAERRDRREYQARIECVQRIEAEADTIQVSGRMVFDQHVGTRDELAENLGARMALRDRA